jgi:uncharacterized protein
LRLSVRLTPRSAKEAVGGFWVDAQGAVWLCASVRAVPEKGKANAALIKLLSRSFNIPSAAISLESGDVSRLKRLRIAGNAAMLARALETWTGEA